MGATKNKSARGIYEILDIVISELLGNDGLCNKFNDISFDLLVCNVFAVLSRNEHTVDTNGSVVLILDSKLCFAIGTKIGQNATLSDFC